LQLIGVWQIREHVRRTVAESGVAFRMSDLGSLVPAPTPAVPRWALYPVTSPTARSAVTLTATPTP
jgi:hypothetical protein